MSYVDKTSTWLSMHTLQNTVLLLKRFYAKKRKPID